MTERDLLALMAAIIYSGARRPTSGSPIASSSAVERAAILLSLVDARQQQKPASLRQ